MKINNSYLRLAIKASRNSDHKRCFHGCVIIRNNHVIAVGFNTMKSHPLSSSIKRTHAELMALSKAKRQDLTGATAIIARLNRQGNVAYSRPCELCWSRLQERGISKVIYTMNSGELKEEVLV